MRGLEPGAALLCAALLCGGCAPPILGENRVSTPGQMVVADLRDYRIEVMRGQPFEVRLPSNPSTGYRWTIVESPVELIDQTETVRYLPGRTDLIGAPGEERFSFLAVKPGAGNLKLEYRRPFEPAEVVAAQRATFKVEIR